MAAGWQIGERIRNRWETKGVSRTGGRIEYVVYDHEHGEPLSVLTFADEVLGADSGLAERFERQARAWSRLEPHQNVVRARRFERIDEKPFLFREYLTGGDLAAWIGSAHLTGDVSLLLRFAIQVSDGLIHAHKHDLSHGDVRPEACLLTGALMLKVGDFGLWGALSAGEETAAREAPEGGARSRAAYLAPERFDDPDAADPRADVYSFGALVYRMVTGRLPFEGSTRVALERQHKNEPPPGLPLAEDPASRPYFEALERVLHRCLAKAPEERFDGLLPARRQLTEIFQAVTGNRVPDPPIGPDLEADDWHNRGMALDRFGRTDQALVCFDRALELNPGYDEIWTARANALRDLDRPAEAAAAFERVLRLNPKDEEAWFNRGTTLGALGEFEEALACFKSALDLNPRDDRAWFNKGVALGALGRHGEALVAYDRALARNPRDGKAWSNKGNALAKLGRHEEALPHYDRALDLNPKDETAWFNKGVTLGKVGRHWDSLESYDRALEINPRNGKAWLNKGAALATLDRFTEALACLQQGDKLGQPQAAQAMALCRQRMLQQAS